MIKMVNILTQLYKITPIIATMIISQKQRKSTKPWICLHGQRYYLDMRPYKPLSNEQCLTAKELKLQIILNKSPDCGK